MSPQVYAPPAARYFNILVEYVDQFREQHPKRNVMITGHSLGGALARISGFLTEYGQAKRGGWGGV
jgi:alpha-beta hydrolase superfamily lysophospholipase